MENKTTPEIYKSMGNIMRNIGAIGKDSKNQQQGYNFRGIDDMYNELHSNFAENGVFILPNVVNSQVREVPSKNGGILFYTTVTINFTFVSALDGSMVTATSIGEAMDSGDKSTNKAMSAALKYVLMQMLLIPTKGENDADYQTHEVKKVAPLPPKQITVKETFEKWAAADASKGSTIFAKMVLENYGNNEQELISAKNLIDLCQKTQNLKESLSYCYEEILQGKSPSKVVIPEKESVI